MGPVAALLFMLNCGGANSAAPSGSPGVTFLDSSHPATDPSPISVAVADFNGDGKLDLAVATGTGPLSILLGNGDGTFTAAPAVPLAVEEANNVVVADFNGDGKPDIAISLADANEVQVLLGNGDGTFTPMPAISTPGVCLVATGTSMETVSQIWFC